MRDPQSAIRAPRFLATGRVLRPGKTLTVCQAHVFGLTEDGRTLVATMISTLITRSAEHPAPTGTV